MKRLKKLCALLLASSMALSLVACGPKDTPASSSSSSTPAVSEPEEPKLVPAYSVEGFETVDADGNRIVEGRDATGSQAMAVASKYEVSQVGAEILKKGGNAVDAAVAMGFALGVCEPFTSGLGGGGLATIHTAEGENYFIDFREVAPAAATLDLYVDANGESNGNTRSGGLASGVPGEVAGLLYMLDNYGTMSRQEVMEPAIRIATEGFTVSQYCANAIADAYETALQFPEMQKVYWDENGLPYEAGDVITNPDLAKTLQKIADEGADAFYTGEVAQAVVDSLAEYDGVMTLEDLANYEAQAITPVTGEYRGYQIISSPPPSSGGTHLIEILNILENFDVGALEVNSPEYCHLFAETFKLAFADRAQYMADTAFTDVPLGGLTSQDYADLRAKSINLDTAMEVAAPDDPSPYEHTDTTHFSIADADGNCVAITKTINYYFGSGVMVKGCGFMMNNQMDDFSTDAESVNKVEPGKKPLSSMSPTVVLKEDGSPFMVLGTPGGSRIFSGVAEVISRVIDHKMDLKTAVCVPKIWNCSNKNNFQYEKALKGYEEYAVTEETAAALTEMGHGEIKTAASGAMQSIMFMEDGTLYGIGDPRQDGKAVGVDK
ncbi:gamma-glutamyltransferase [Pseudoflavonifractor phocaeensis]|uniref:gamma-glutamyltransferase n=1 Tax=Pseudoflavonifractor phocaeensis TaxID=1870988 RepID=UPI001F369AD3|nr:gamma-glutamyltransferase [Pseudoflavonifractor phocaeensis]MCF2596489.1 gamma-glutamyltransferase [Pseudoflavonifractor phocaeensis]